MRRIIEKHRTLAERSLPRFVLAVLVAGALLLGAPSAEAAGTPQQKCQSAKDKAAGKYAACRQNAEAKLATSGDTTKYGPAIAKCTTKFGNSWLKANENAAKALVSCLDAPLTGAQFQTVIDYHTDNITTALGGGGLIDYAAAVACGNGTINAGEQCDQGNLNGETCVLQGFGAGALACGSGCLFDTTGCFTLRFVDNSDGTITDNQTGLMWEKKADLDGLGVICASTVACPDPHDADNLYTFSFDNPLGPPGTAYTVFLAQLNTGFAGYVDWRLPTEEELQGIVDYADSTSPVVNASFDTGCTGSCTVTTCSCTTPSRHWSSSTTAINAGRAWVVDFSWGDVQYDSKDSDYSARAVRNLP